jgi:hypothetical protein
MARARENSDPEALAIAALGFLASDGERLGRFLAVTGLGPESLRATARESGFLASVLGYLAEDETLLLAFAADNGVAPESIARARRRLAGPPPDFDGS